MLPSFHRTRLGHALASPRASTFSRFVLRLIDSSRPAVYLDAIRANAETRCPRSAAPLCRSLLDALAVVDADAGRAAPDPRRP
jgi:hypothetical protein